MSFHHIIVSYSFILSSSSSLSNHHLTVISWYRYITSSYHHAIISYHHMVIPSHRMMISSYHIIIASYHSSIYRQHHSCHFGISFVPCMCCRDVHHVLQTQRLHQPIVYSILHHGEDIQEPHRVKQPWAAPCHTAGNGPHLQRHQR